VLLVAVGVLALDGGTRSSDAQTTVTDVAPLLGVWEGGIRQGSTDAERIIPTRLEFAQHPEGLRWRLIWDGGASFARGEAEGSVTRFSPPSLELAGVYVFHTSLRVQGSPITMSLMLAGDRIDGQGLTSKVNRTFTIGLERKR
jgi:hypothetical protein